MQAHNNRMRSDSKKQSVEEHRFFLPVMRPGRNVRDFGNIDRNSELISKNVDAQKEYYDHIEEKHR